MKTVFDLSRDEIVALTDEEISLYIDKELAGNGDMEVAMNFIKEAYPFNEETESFIRKKFDMPIPDESKEQ